MQRPPGVGEAHQEAARAVPVSRVILDGLRRRDGLANLPHADPAQDRLIDGMPRELEIAAADLRPDVVDQGHLDDCTPTRSV
jgi:hypothetical protein